MVLPSYEVQWNWESLGTRVKLSSNFVKDLRFGNLVIAKVIIFKTELTESTVECRKLSQHGSWVCC